MWELLRSVSSETYSRYDYVTRKFLNLRVILCILIFFKKLVTVVLILFVNINQQTSCVYFKPCSKPINITFQSKHVGFLHEKSFLKLGKNVLHRHRHWYFCYPLIVSTKVNFISFDPERITTVDAFLDENHFEYV